MASDRSGGTCNLAVLLTLEICKGAPLHRRPRPLAPGAQCSTAEPEKWPPRRSRVAPPNSSMRSPDPKPGCFYMIVCPCLLLSMLLSHSLLRLPCCPQTVNLGVGA